ncbi:hypothetical protein CI102_3333 [Trichoderma harzianum]|uniref:Uncharacterized protein n=1 Tax=Trichoderma harzianum CBS 226.95 TaxID=983964 RepID=A0A2T4A170_TRIHA|nr:hypothetical protein M431DRAFT_246060 [Trichoderma harzianum CBS 226.95]PKK51673.1 hypothetical protein CI102_3333 [Trichoderma harzianum]PTB50821.1 hypothetical protein M431DRAFT_246060 [Trichoderma harzianum CBS 226.95]
MYHVRGVPERYVGVTEKPASDSKRSLMCAAVRGGKSQIGGFFCFVPFFVFFSFFRFFPFFLQILCSKPPSPMFGGSSSESQCETKEGFEDSKPETEFKSSRIR